MTGTLDTLGETCTLNVTGVKSWRVITAYCPSQSNVGGGALPFLKVSQGKTPLAKYLGTALPVAANHEITFGLGLTNVSSATVQTAALAELSVTGDGKLELGDITGGNPMVACTFVLEIVPKKDAL